jgi:hypothetical protein
VKGESVRVWPPFWNGKCKIAGICLSPFTLHSSQFFMSLRRWVREQMLGSEPEGNDSPPRGSLGNNASGREREQPRSLGEYDALTYPVELAEVLRRRAEVARDFMRLDVTDPAGRMAAIPRLKELLGRYPHPLVYESLIHAFVDAERYDEARGVAFAARERRHECARSPHPEIRSETDGLREWKPEDVDALREEVEKRARG